MAKFKFKWDSDPVINLFNAGKATPSEFQFVQNELMNIYSLRNKNKNQSCIEFHKAKLGKQLTTWVGGSENRKYYIWEGENWRIFVHNVGGISFEVRDNISKKEALGALQDYLNRIK